MPPSKKKHMQFQLPVQRVYEILSETYPSGVSASSTVYMTAVLEYLTAEILELASIKATERKSRHITKRDIAYVLQTDEELRNAFPGAVEVPEENTEEAPPGEPSLVQERLSKRLGMK